MSDLVTSTAGQPSRRFQSALGETPALAAVARRAVEAAIWGMPVVNYDLMLQEMLTKTTGQVNEVIFWGRCPDCTNNSNTTKKATREENSRG